MLKPSIRRRIERLSPAALPADLHPVVRRVLSRRDLHSAAQLNYELDQLIPWSTLQHIEQAAALLADAVQAGQHILIAGDFDTDGASSCALSVLALRALGAAQVSYLVPDRFRFGYGLTPEIVDVAAKSAPDIIVTVDNGISSVEGVARAKELGIPVIITDHHLAGKELPDAAVIVNPNAPGDSCPSKALCGCTVVFYVLLALRAKLQQQGWFEQAGIASPNMARYLDLVALATVADVVPLDYNNRILVAAGLERIRAGRCRPGIIALLELGNRQLHNITASDLGFCVGPRLNAAGRLDDMSLGIECLLAEDRATALRYARALDEFNRERREIEQSMKDAAVAELDSLNLAEDELPAGLCVFDESWHEGVIGLLAARIKDRYHRPTVALAANENNPGLVKGSARSIPGVHIRDLLDELATQHPGLLDKFGGHAMAAGLSLSLDKLADFQAAFAKVAANRVSEEQLEAEIFTDGELTAAELNLEAADALATAGPWGQQFPEPLFDGCFTVQSRRIVGEYHLKLQLLPESVEQRVAPLEAIAFHFDPDYLPNVHERVQLVYKLQVNEYMGRRTAQLAVQHLTPAAVQ